MEQREAAICQWFDMWLTKRDTGIRDLFRPGRGVHRSWGPEYHGADKIAWWFTESGDRRGTVEQWDIRQFFHKGDQTVVEWTFANRMDDGRREVFEGHDPGPLDGNRGRSPVSRSSAATWAVTTPTPTARSPGSGTSRRPGSENQTTAPVPKGTGAVV